MSLKLKLATEYRPAGEHLTNEGTIVEETEINTAIADDDAAKLKSVGGSEKVFTIHCSCVTGQINMATVFDEYHPS